MTHPHICHNYLPSEHHDILEIAKQWPGCRCVDFHHVPSLLSRSKEALFTLRLYVPWSKLGSYNIYIYIYIRDGHQPIFIGIDILITKGTKYGMTINIIYHALTMVQIGIGTRQVYQLAAPKRQVRSQPVGCHHTVLLLFCSTNLNGLD